MRTRDNLHANGITISYLVEGPPDACPIVLVHGGSLDVSSWSATMTNLGTDHRVYAVDMRGHGRSSWASEYGFPQLANDVTEFIAQLALRDVVLIGHSLGGTAAYLAAQRQPAWLSALVIEEPLILRPGKVQPTTPSRTTEATTYDRDTLMSTLVPQYYDADPAWWNQLVDITVPTLYFAGTSDPDQLRDHSDAALRIPECEWARVPVGHHIHRDEPDEFLARLRRFLQQNRKIPTAGVQD